MPNQTDQKHGVPQKLTDKKSTFYSAVLLEIMLKALSPILTLQYLFTKYSVMLRCWDKPFLWLSVSGKHTQPAWDNEASRRYEAQLAQLLRLILGHNRFHMVDWNKCPHFAMGQTFLFDLHKINIGSMVHLLLGIYIFILSCVSSYFTERHV